MHARQERHHDIVVVVQVAGFQVGGLSCQRRLLKYNRNKKGLAMIHTFILISGWPHQIKTTKNIHCSGGSSPPPCIFTVLPGYRVTPPPTCTYLPRLFRLFPTLHLSNGVHCCTALRAMETGQDGTDVRRCQQGGGDLFQHFHQTATVKTVQSVKMCTCCNYM